MERHYREAPEYKAAERRRELRALGWRVASFVLSLLMGGAIGWVVVFACRYVDSLLSR